MCFSTARLVRNSEAAIAPLLLPAATSASTSRSRAVSSSSGDAAEPVRSAISRSMIFASTTERPSATAWIASTS